VPDCLYDIVVAFEVEMREGEGVEEDVLIEGVIDPREVFLGVVLVDGDPAFALDGVLDHRPRAVVDGQQ
jgi:hypothetical protein